MKNIVRLVAAAAVAATTFAAQAADLPSSKAPPPAPIFVAYDWSGFYVGAHAGYGWGRHNRLTTTGFANSYNSSGWLLGVHAGYNIQFAPMVVGLEGDVSYASINGNDAGVGGTTDRSRYRWLGSLRARIGVAIDRVLIYATGGWAFASINHANLGPPVDSFSSSVNGWTAGAGLEYAMTNNWLLRAEYRYTDYGRYNRPAPTNGVFPYRVRNTLHTVRVGLSYKF